MIEFIRACCDGDIERASQVLEAEVLTVEDIGNFVNSFHPVDHYSLLYRCTHILHGASLKQCCCL